MFPKALLLASLYAGMALVVVVVYRRLLGSKTANSSRDGSRFEYDGQPGGDGGDFGYHDAHGGGFDGHGDGDGGHGDGGGGGDGGGDGGDGGD